MHLLQTSTCTHLSIGSIAREASHDLMSLLIVQRHVGPFLGVPVGNKSLLLTDAKMGHISAVLPDDVPPGIVQTKAAVLDAELPAAAHGFVVVLDTESLAFGHADLVGLATTGTDGVVDASEASILDRGYPIVWGHCVCFAFSLVGKGVGAKSGSGSILLLNFVGSR